MTRKYNSRSKVLNLKKNIRSNEDIETISREINSEKKKKIFFEQTDSTNEGRRVLGCKRLIQDGSSKLMKMMKGIWGSKYVGKCRVGHFNFS